ncbi:MAG: hypothetical protein G01um101425_170 [Candidatus Peregrinibacteria bacterium Gr01-1014_25]|nr:MAG: hypothetical protein G01um101425_170 [Candidatus Peregrinibacteria bacterium Gr01-1014_25]
MILPVLLLSAALLLPMPALAASEDCSGYLRISPVSTYVQMVLKRADAGIAQAQSSSAAADFAPLHTPGWLRSIDRAVRSLLDSELRVGEREQELALASACLHLDSTLLSCAIDRTRTEIHSALQRGSWVGLWQLIDLLGFLQERQRQLVLGATDPLYRDTQWHRTRSFDPQEATYGTLSESTSAATCGDGLIQGAEECDDGNGSDGDGCGTGCTSEVCPFHSDYLTPGVTGYGCDATVMTAGDRLLFPPMESELNALQVLGATYGSFASILSDTSTGQQYNTDTSVHRTADGCVRWLGVCLANSSAPCSQDSDCYGSLGGICLQTKLVGAVRASNRHPFALEKDAWNSVRVFRTLRQKEGEARYSRDEETGRAPSMFSTAFRLYERDVSSLQGAWEALMFAEGVDPQRMIEDALSPFSGVVSSISTLANSPKGMRAFAERLSLYLLRTCMDRPCTLRLLHILKIVKTDSCFPYTNGEFLEHSCQEPDWKVCIDAVKETESDASDLPGFSPFAVTYPEPECSE